MGSEHHISEAVEGAVEAAPDPYVGTTLGDKYRVVRKIGDGGMGSVYEAEHTIIGRRVAIKMLHLQYATQHSTVKRFTNEARAAAMIGHPNILECTDLGKAPDGAPFLVLELLEGSDLAAVIAKEGPLPVGRVARIAMAAASALQAAHDKGIVHRDMKPENIFLTERDGNPDHVKVLDFGISKFQSSSGVSQAGTQAGSVLGTPYYMAPEQVRDASTVEPRADIYALGAIVYEALTGRVPHEADSLPGLFLKICSEAPVSIAAYRRDVPAPVVHAVERAMEGDPEDRFLTVAELSAALAPYADRDDPPELIHAPDASLRAGSEATQKFLAAHKRSGVRERWRDTLGGSSAGKRWILGLSLMGLGLAFIAGAVAFTLTKREEPGIPEASAAATPGPVPPEPPPSSTPVSAEEPPPLAAAEPATASLSIESPHPRAEAVIRGQVLSLPFRRAFSLLEEEEPILVRAPSHESRVYRLTLTEPTDLWAELDRDRRERVRDATPEELALALEGRPEESESRPGAQPAPTASAERPVVRRQAPAEMRASTPMVERRAAPTSPMARPGVYSGPSGELPDF